MHKQAAGKEVQDCIQACKDCHQICVATSQYCLDEGAEHAEAAHVRLLLDCADICAAAENSMSRASPFDAAICGVCADVCDACAASCETFKGNGQMKDCASACHACAQKCLVMAGTGTRRTP